jgi:preprotein translocase subunit SecB
MNHSPLQLERYFFVKASLQAQPKGDPQALNSVQTQFEVSQASERPNDYMVSLTVRLMPLENNSPAYIGEFIVVGFFKVHETYPKDKCAKLVGVNGAGILYGVVREMVANLTARGPFPMLGLVSLNFNDAIKEAVLPKTLQPHPRVATKKRTSVAAHKA